MKYNLTKNDRRFPRYGYLNLNAHNRVFIDRLSRHKILSIIAVNHSPVILRCRKSNT